VNSPIVTRPVWYSTKSGAPSFELLKAAQVVSNRPPDAWRHYLIMEDGSLHHLYDTPVGRLVGASAGRSELREPSARHQVQGMGQGTMIGSPPSAHLKVCLPVHDSGVTASRSDLC